MFEHTSQAIMGSAVAVARGEVSPCVVWVHTTACFLSFCVEEVDLQHSLLQLVTWGCSSAVFTH